MIFFRIEILILYRKWSEIVSFWNLQRQRKCCEIKSDLTSYECTESNDDNTRNKKTKKIEKNLWSIFRIRYNYLFDLFETD